MATTENETHIHHHEEAYPSGRRPMSLANWVGVVLLLAAIAFYLGFAVPEFIGIISGRPLALG